MSKHLYSIYYILFSLLLINSCKEEKTEKDDHYPNGDISKVTLINGKKQGDMLLYFSTGELKSSVHFENDKRTGKTIHYFKNGKLQSIEEYTNGVKNGYVKKFDSTGTMYFNAKYKMDTLVEVKGVVLQR